MNSTLEHLSWLEIGGEPSFGWMGGSSNALWKRLFECFIVLSLIGDMGERLNNRSTHEDWVNIRN